MTMRDSDPLEALRFAIREANSWLERGEGVDLLYYWPKDVEPILRAVIATEIGAIPDEIGPAMEPPSYRVNRELEVAREVLAARRAGMSKETAIAELTILNLDPLTASRMWDAADRSRAHGDA